MTVDGRAIRAQWDAACDEGRVVLLRYRDLARERGDKWPAKYLTSATDQLETLRRVVNGRRHRPGTIAPGLVRDAPEELWYEPYLEAGATLDSLTQLYVSGLGAPDWDWSRGYPPGWPTSLRDRIRAYTPMSTP